MDEQRRLILDQFTRQAVPFSEMHARDDAEIHQLLIDTAGITPDDEVLDVACGPGLVACVVAQVARHVTGIDLTAAMIDQARTRQESLGLRNLTWMVGDAQPLPFPTASFSRVITRYSFHHFTDPAGVFAEMVRVCRPGGRVTVADVFTTSAEQAEAYDRLERFRDPSHTHALQLTEFESLFAGLAVLKSSVEVVASAEKLLDKQNPATTDPRILTQLTGLEEVRRQFYKYPVKVEELLARSFPDPGGADAFRRTIEADIGVDRIGISAAREGGLRFAFPVVIISGKKTPE